MDLRTLSRNARSGERLRRTYQRNGCNNAGCLLWTKEEDELVRSLYPDYEKLKQCLRRRTRPAIKHRAALLGIVKRRHRWTAQEVSRLRRIFPSATKEELMEAFPGLSLSQIQGRAKDFKIHRRKRPPTPSGHPLIDHIKLRARELNYTMADVDALAGSGNYFYKAVWINGTINNRVIANAVLALDGYLKIKWRE